ncbi:MAG TPA: 6-hydroxymethylpterin diphosphokinase MptE-like protein, partial [Methanobacteriaceae archaeon]|nr:6-hydroxymethylpterin diphosphokinase MptE-like protein [Methanobacteriaceae archaeon]
MIWYEKILEDFGFSRYDDEESAKLLDRLLYIQGSLAWNEIPVKEKTIVFGAGPSLKRNIIELKKIELDDFLLIAADGATTALLEENIVPDIIVTDLDGRMDTIFKANRLGSVMVVHAHGDNFKKISKYVPELLRVIGTTQSTPLANVYNWGGFTDGDRAVFLAVELGVKVI